MAHRRRVSDELARGIIVTIVAGLYLTVCPIKYVEGLGDEVPDDMLATADGARQTHVGAEVIRAEKRIAGVTGQTIVVYIAIAVRIACHRGIHRAPRSCGDHRRRPPVVH